MPKITIKDITPKNPISIAGEMIAPCYGSDTSNPEKNYKRGLNAIKDGHFRTLEYADVWFIMEDVSARTARQFYTHIGGAPTRTQASTRYINESNFKYYTPPYIKENLEDDYDKIMSRIQEAYTDLIEHGANKEDAANILPLGMMTTVSVRMNPRTLMTMAQQRLCTRTYHEYRQLMRDIIAALSNYSEEWKTLCGLVMKCKCDVVGYCCEGSSCGRYPKKDSATA